jgi:hypothetical protein
MERIEPKMQYDKDEERRLYRVKGRGCEEEYAGTAWRGRDERLTGEEGKRRKGGSKIHVLWMTVQ